MKEVKFLAVLFFALLSGAVEAQFRNVRLDEQTTDNYSCEPSIAINPRDPLNIVAASVLNNVYYTKDGGTTWQRKKLESTSGVYGDPALIADTHGNFYYFHLSDPTGGKGDYESEKLDRIVVQISGDGGETWSDGESIGLNHPKDQDKPWPAIDMKNNLYVTWTQFDKYRDTNPDCKSNIMISTSRSGKKWSEPVSLSQNPGDCLDDDNTVQGAVPAVSIDGKMFVTWAKGGKIFLDRSFDGGRMWLSNDIAIADQPGGWNMKVPGHDRCNGMPVLLTDRSKGHYRGSLYVLWADQRRGENDTDIWFTRSNNFGDNWSSPARVNDDGPGKHQYLPWMAVDQTTGYIYILYYDRRNYDDLQTDVYLAYSVDGGLRFKNVKISETPFTPSGNGFFGDYLNIDAYKGIITPVWTRMDDGKTSVWTAVIRHEDLVAGNR